jgi:hypothetical protein
MTEEIHVLFLDIDGILVPFQTPKGRENLIWSTEAMECLNAIWEHTRAQTVISSSWRLECTRDQMLSMLNEHGFTGKLHQDWRTPGDENLLNERGAEILEWLDGHKNVAEWLVLEDSAEAIAHFAPEIIKRMIRPISEVGLTKPALESALKIISKG